MDDLVGRSFTIADGRYRIVDVRRLSGDAMVYAELLEAGGGTREPAGPRPAPRTAFHYDDIVPLLDGPVGA